jgi:hypothetical protein
MSIYDAGTFFQHTLAQALSGSNSQQRVPFTFTSTKRLLEAGVVGVGTSRGLAATNADTALKNELLAMEESSLATAILPPEAIQYANELSVQPTMPVISMMVNPHTVRWSQTKRYLKKDTMNGSVFFHFSDENGQNNDILQLHFMGNTGNINTKDITASHNVGGDAKLRIWHELYALTREPVLLDGGVQNEFFISYRTPLIPLPITFIGFFNAVLEFSENAQQPLHREYSFAFTVTNTSPKLDVLVNKISTAVATSNLLATVGIK